MTNDQIKAHTIDFAIKMANDGAEPADQLTAVALLIQCSLKAVTPLQRTKIASIYFDTIRANL
ncbi:MAG: hypothetical protein KGZ65_04015 [Sphingomonadales bacterium]|nr:hypothetical protein [Sphingomonadaceae bacterium]MBS3930378.1 hypothetical protein [Sphingomonadales bacterium]